MSNEKHHTRPKEHGHRRQSRLIEDTYRSRHDLYTAEDSGLRYKGRNRAEKKRGKEFRRPFNGRATNG